MKKNMMKDLAAVAGFFGVLRLFSRSFRFSEVERQGRGQCTGTDP